jgi:ATP-dependent protease HslVU (ClpYQ) ATPase subunit
MQSISRRGALFATLLIAITAIAYAQGRHGTARSLVDRVQKNLRHSEDFTPPNEKERERYHNAQHHLSEFDQKLSEGKFDKDKLDVAIDDVKNVVEHNTLSAEDRDKLTRDLGELRELRRTRGAAY